MPCGREVKINSEGTRAGIKTNWSSSDDDVGSGRRDTGRLGGSS